jgi:phenylpyruvate tautomerase PptA (4-oxalocrotonate tautomerase family)
MMDVGVSVTAASVEAATAALVEAATAALVETARKRRSASKYAHQREQ